MPLRIFVVAALLLSSTYSCGRDANDQLRAELETAKSWAATAHMTADQWIAGGVPAEFAITTLEAARREIQKIGDQASDSAVSNNGVTRHLTNLTRIIHVMRDAVQARDRAAMARHISQLATEEQALRVLSEREQDGPGS
jgi:hypothetical protein